MTTNADLKVAHAMLKIELDRLTAIRFPTDSETNRMRKVEGRLVNLVEWMKNYG